VLAAGESPSNSSRGLWSSDLGEIDVEAMTADDRSNVVRLYADFCPEERAWARTARGWKDVILRNARGLLFPLEQLRPI
jgi:hypothetical protein